jgi:hypothetical protein
VSREKFDPLFFFDYVQGPGFKHVRTSSGLFGFTQLTEYTWLDLWPRLKLCQAGLVTETASPDADPKTRAAGAKKSRRTSHFINQGGLKQAWSLLGQRLDNKGGPTRETESTAYSARRGHPRSLQPAPFLRGGPDGGQAEPVPAAQASRFSRGQFYRREKSSF